MLSCGTIQMKKFIKKSLSKSQANEDQHIIEKRWSNIYQDNKRSKFYSIIKKKISSISASMVLDYGCSIGIMSNYLADSSTTVFGVDRSFSALVIAKKHSKKNADYIVANIPNNIFGKTSFDLILGLNVLELVEPTTFLDKTSKQIRKGHIVLTDPYDYDRGTHSVKKPLTEITLRQYLSKLGFVMVNNTSQPSHLSWNLKLNSRASLNYKVDLVIGKKN
ncbi:MAG: methyltransferase domain-containing protein [Nitrosopumilaceae archaeon]|nr:methyltransferase domain-containing protein [Nitrosopumilaceae archaeon]